LYRSTCSKTHPKTISGKLMKGYCHIQKQAKLLSMQAMEMKRQIKSLHESDGPRYCVWFWVTAGKGQHKVLQIYEETDRLDEAHSILAVCNSQPCCGLDNRARIYDRVQQKDIIL